MKQNVLMQKLNIYDGAEYWSSLMKAQADPALRIVRL